MIASLVCKQAPSTRACFAFVADILSYETPTEALEASLTIEQVNATPAPAPATLPHV